MLKVQEVREIIRLIDESSIDEFTYETNGTKIKLKKNTSEQTIQKIPVPVEQSTEAQTQAKKVVEGEKAAKVHTEKEVLQEEEVATHYDYEIVSPMVGTFYKAPSPESDPYVSLDSNVDESSIVCIVEAMKLFNEIEAEVSGTIVEILVEDGDLVEYGQPLFRVKKK